MKQILVLFATATLLLVAGCHSTGERAGQSKLELKACMDRYIEFFNAGNSGAIAREIYTPPVLLISPETDQHTVFEATTDVEQFFADSFKKIKSKGWARSVVHKSDYYMAGPDMAIVSTTFLRLQANGEAISPARRIANYLYVNTEQGWRAILVSSQPEEDKPTLVDETDDLRKLMGQYIDYLNGDNPAGNVSSKIWQTPRISRSFMGTRKHSTVLTEELAYEKLDGYIKKLKTEGLERFIIQDVTVRMVSKNLAFVELVSSRVKKDGTPIPPANTPFTYVWVKKSTGWRMIATLAHGPKTTLVK
tara:strand:+ start:667 stop:1581 length:915 start_codon:yes stop_codon:yes gene_type:complete